MDPKDLFEHANQAEAGRNDKPEAPSGTPASRLRDAEISDLLAYAAQRIAANGWPTKPVTFADGHAVNAWVFALTAGTAVYAGNESQNRHVDGPGGGAVQEFRTSRVLALVPSGDLLRVRVAGDVGPGLLLGPEVVDASGTGFGLLSAGPWQGDREDLLRWLDIVPDAPIAADEVAIDGRVTEVWADASQVAKSRTAHATRSEAFAQQLPKFFANALSEAVNNSAPQQSGAPPARTPKRRRWFG